MPCYVVFTFSFLQSNTLLHIYTTTQVCNIAFLCLNYSATPSTILPRYIHVHILPASYEVTMVTQLLASQLHTCIKNIIHDYMYNVSELAILWLTCAARVVSMEQRIIRIITCSFCSLCYQWKFLDLCIHVWYTDEIIFLRIHSILYVYVCMMCSVNLCLYLTLPSSMY